MIGHLAGLPLGVFWRLTGLRSNEVARVGCLVLRTEDGIVVVKYAAPVSGVEAATSPDGDLVVVLVFSDVVALAVGQHLGDRKPASMMAFSVASPAVKKLKAPSRIRLSGAPVLGALDQELGRLTDILQPAAIKRDTLAVVDVDRAEVDRHPADFEAAYKRRAGELEHIRVDLLGR